MVSADPAGQAFLGLPSGAVPGGLRAAPMVSARMSGSPFFPLYTFAGSDGTCLSGSAAPPSRTSVVLLVVSPISSNPADITAATQAYVDYLCGGGGGGAAPVGNEGAVDYYAAGSAPSILDGTGWWSGNGADHYDLHGRVDRSRFVAMLQGRHHQTGERLISARGSSGRIHLKMGNPTRWIKHRPAWSLADATAVYGGPLPTAALAPKHILAADQERFISLQGMKILMNGRRTKWSSTTIEDIAAGQGPIKLAELAAATGVTSRYLSGICSSITKDEKTDDAGLNPRKQGHIWIVDRAGALKWAAVRKPPNVVAGYDITMTTEKSLSVFALVNPEVRDDCIDILRNANTAALKWLELKAGTGRSKGESISSHGHTVASFMHSTSREDDPFMHIHNIVLNAIVDKNGTGRALDATGLYSQAPAAAALATATLRRSLTERFGLEWRLDGRDTWQIDGISDEALDGFSTRSAQIANVLTEMFGDDAADHEGREISASTRRTKTGNTVDHLTEEWQQRATDYGYSEQARQAVFNRRTHLIDGELTDRQRSALWRWLESPDGVCKKDARFDSGDVFWAITNWAPGGRLALLNPQQIIAETRRFIDSEHVVSQNMRRSVASRGHKIGRNKEPAFTTQVMIDLQNTIAHVWAAGRTRGLAQIDSRRLTAAINASDITLSGEQQDLVRSWVSSGHAIQAAIGRPGTGKTTTMRVAVDAWQRAGFQVKGAAVKGEAARILGKEADLNANTVAHYLAIYRRGHNPLDTRTVLIVDEASTLSDWDLADLIAMTTEAGAGLRLIGDPAQHQSVQAGGSWETQLTRFAIDTPELKNQRRLKNPVEVEATELIRSGELKQALATLDSIGHVQTFDNWDDAYPPLIQRWWTMRQQGNSHPLVERTNTQRQILNALCQHVRVRAGEVTNVIEYGGSKFGIGDEVIAKQPARNLRSQTGEYIRNGSTGVITDITKQGLTIDFEDIGTITVPPHWAMTSRSLDLAYAMTSFSIQGATNDASTSVITPGASHAELLVNLTRGRHENVVFDVRSAAEAGRPPRPPQRLVDRSAGLGII